MNDSGATLRATAQSDGTITEVIDFTEPEPIYEEDSRPRGENSKITPKEEIGVVGGTNHVHRPNWRGGWIAPYQHRSGVDSALTSPISKHMCSTVISNLYDNLWLFIIHDFLHDSLRLHSGILKTSHRHRDFSTFETTELNAENNRKMKAAQTHSLISRNDERSEWRSRERSEESVKSRWVLADLNQGTKRA